MVISETNSCFDEGFDDPDENRILALQSKNTMNYLKVLGALCAFALSALTVNATVWTVSNNADRPAQFTTIQSAVDAASPGDTLLITGGTYGGATLVKNLVFYGEAIEGSEFPITTMSSTLNILRFNSSLSASGSRFYGMRFNATVNIDANFSGAGAGQELLDDLIFERCHFLSSIVQYSRDGLSNVTYRNCLFSGVTYYASASGAVNISNILHTNNVYDNCNISGGFGFFDLNGNMVIRNSMFLNRTSSSFSNAQELVLENNIFYKAEPTGLSTSTFNNNLTYLCNANDIPYGDNIGSGNIVNQDPQLTNYPALGAAHSWDWDYTPQAGSPCLGNGTNGSDIGISGGNAPVANLPRYAKIPGVTLLDIPVSSVPVGGTLQINIEAESRD